MPQFPSVAARRHNTLGHGIVSRVPYPTGPLLYIDADNVIVEPPQLSPLQCASWIERLYRYSSQYEAIAERYVDDDEFSASRIPERYSIGPMDDNFSDLWTKYLELSPAPWMLPHRPIEGETPGNTGLTQFGTVQHVEPIWTVNSEIDAIFANARTTKQFVGAQAGIGQALVTCPAQTFEVAYDDGSPITRWTKYAESVTTTANANVGGAEVPIAILVLQLLIHGACQAPDGFAGADRWSPSKDGPWHEVEWLRYICGCAGRWVWQMCWLQWWLMHDDLTNRHEGGRGGTTGTGYEDEEGRKPRMSSTVGGAFDLLPTPYIPVIQGSNAAGAGAIV